MYNPTLLTVQLAGGGFENSPIGDLLHVSNTSVGRTVYLRYDGDNNDNTPGAADPLPRVSQADGMPIAIDQIIMLDNGQGPRQPFSNKRLSACCGPNLGGTSPAQGVPDPSP